MMSHSTGIHQVNKGFFVVCPEQNPETMTTNIESRLWTSLLHKTGRLSHYKLPILSFPVKPLYLSTVSLSHYDQPSLTKPVCSAVLCDLELQSGPTHFSTPPELSVFPVCLCFELQVSHTFTDYGPGLSYISFEHGGQDTKFWDGWFGVRVTGSSVMVEV